MIACIQIVLRSPKANAISERVIGTYRRECLDWLIPLSESHLRSMLKVWATHYNRARPHMALGPGPPIRLRERYYASTRSLGIILLRRQTVAKKSLGRVTKALNEAHDAD